MKLRKTLKVCLVITFTLCFYSPSLFAQPIPTTEPYFNISMTTEEGNSAAKPFPYTYGWNEQPWLFLKLKAGDALAAVGGTSVTKTYWTWDNPSGEDPLPYIEETEGTLNGQWPNLDNWNDIRKLGNWTIIANTTLTINSYPSYPKEYYTGSTSFKVIPEPASMILYVLGGLSLASGFFRKKKSYLTQPSHARQRARA